MIVAINKKEVPRNIIASINLKINELNSFSGDTKTLIKLIKKTEKEIIKQIESEFGLVKKSHYQNHWMAYGIMAGVLFSTIATQFGFDETWNSVGFGISMGLIFGMIAGKNKDVQVAKEGLQLEV